jgi:hypothetical protein
MGEHDQTVLHDKDAHEDLGDDGRRFHPIDVGDRFFQGAGGGANDPAYNNPDPYLDPDKYKFTQVFRFFHDTLTPDSVLVQTRPFSPTKWESLYSSLFGTGVRGDVVPWFDGKDLEVEASFTPIIDESYRVIGHLGWIDIGQICMRNITDERGTGTAFHLEKARLAQERQQILWRYDHPNEAFRFPGQRARDSWEPDFIRYLRKSPLKDGSEEQRHLKNLNFFLKAGGKALVGREVAKALLESERYALYEYTGYRCFALVSPDGHLQAVLGVEKIPYESFNDRSMRPVFKAIDIALTIMMIIDIATISVGLIRAGRLVGEIIIRALAVTVDREAKAALELAMRETMRDLTETELLAARGAAPGDGSVLISAEDLNKFVPQERSGLGPKRRLNPDERAGAMKIIDVLQKMRGAPDLDKQIAQMLEDLGKDNAKRRAFQERVAGIARKDKIGKMLRDFGNGKLVQEKFMKEVAELAKADEQIGKMLKELRERGDGEKFIRELGGFANNVQPPPPWAFIKELTAKPLEFRALAQQGWMEIYVTPAGVGALNQMRVLFRNAANGLEARLMHMH